MMGFYNETAGRWQPEIAWWLSGNALQALLDYVQRTGDRTYMPQVLRTVDAQTAPLDWWPEGGGYFRADSTDDTGWWALAMVRAFDVTGNATYLDYAKLDEDYMHNYWSDDCGGGIIWNIPNLEYKNAISNELYFTLAAALHNRIPGDEDYLARALDAWGWFEASGMINSAHLVNDGLTEDTCVNNGATTWTYNQGVVLGGLVELYRATDDEDHLGTAKQIADAVLASSALVVDGVLMEPCDGGEAGCDFNQQAFKGIFMRYLGVLDEALCVERPYRDFIRANAETAWAMGRNETDYFDVRWNGPFDNATVATQASAASLMVAAMDWAEVCST
ncbi:Glycosyl hydrolase [Coniochaeta hoffmannii]|uniref:Glycosyl hydrolase n=1 Tax=Coniochaeta hoffmannii TaxID=91930 RepID=A0AA38S2P4_9PEZI|nr:Glycosyl hydrolase [Coniochaeta hoffmannii]